MEDLKKEIADLKQQLWELKTSVAAQKPVDEIVKYLLYFWLTISIVLGIFGWKQLSDIDAQIKIAVSSQFPQDSENYKNYKKLLDDTNKLYSDFQGLAATYKERVEDLKYADVVASDFDLEGQIQKILIESNNIANVLDSAWRTKAITVLSKLKVALKEKTFPATFVFNAAQVCRQLQQFQLAEDMTNAAYDKDPSPPIKALKLASEVSTKTGQERSKAYLELVKMVENLDYESSPHIVLAEAWNAAESSRNYKPLIDSLDVLIANSGNLKVPSYAHLIKAQAMLRQGSSEYKQSAIAELKRGYELYLEESSLSQWSDSFKQEYPELIAVVDDNMTMDTSIAEEGQLESKLELLRELMSENPEINR